MQKPRLTYSRRARNPPLCPLHPPTPELSNVSPSSPLTDWNHAMKEELNALKANHIWDIVPLHANYPVVGSKWVYSVKQKYDGSLDRYKARLVAQGFT